MTRRFYPGVRTQQAPGRDIAIGIRLPRINIASEDSPPTSTQCAPRLTWINGTAGSTPGYDGLPALIVSNSAEDWQYHFAGTNSYTGTPIIDDIQIVERLGPYIRFLVNTDNVEIIITATNGDQEVGPIIYLVPPGGG